MNKSIKKRLKRLAEHTEQGEVICFVFPDRNGGYYAEWNGGRGKNRRDGFSTVDEALEFAQGINKIDDIFYHSRDAMEVITIVDEWGGEYDH